MMMMMMISEENEEELSSAFLELKQYCLQLLELLRNPNNKGSTTVISNLLQFIRRSRSHALQPFFDYTLFPLLLLLEAALECRSSQKDEFKEKPPKISDALVEGMIQCLEELLMRCQVGSVDQRRTIVENHGE